MKISDHTIAAPRTVPVSTKLYLYFGGIRNQVGWIIFAIGIFLFTFYEVPLLIKSHMAFSREVENTKGVVIKYYDTGKALRSSGKIDVPIFGVNFSFEDKSGKKTFATSYTTDKVFHAGDVVDVEFSQSNPDYVRIKGLSYTISTSGLLVLPFLFVVWILGVGCISANFIKRKNIAWLIQFGETAEARLISKKATAFNAGEGKPFYNLIFEFKDSNGILHTIKTKTHLVDTLERDNKNFALYNPANPKRSVLINLLPSSLTINSSGEVVLDIENVSTRVIISLILPCASLAGMLFLITHL